MISTVHSLSTGWRNICCSLLFFLNEVKNRLFEVKLFFLQAFLKNKTNLPLSLFNLYLGSFKNIYSWNMEQWRIKHHNLIIYCFIVFQSPTSIKNKISVIAQLGKNLLCLQCRRSGFNSCLRKIPLEKEMATHSSILAWIMPWTKEPSGQFHGVTEVRHDLGTKPPIENKTLVKSWLIGKDPDVERDWGQEEKGTTEDELVGWHHRLDGREFG